MNRSEVPTEFRESGIAGKITPSQRAYIISLTEQKDLSRTPQDQIDLLFKSLRISEDPEELGMTRTKASEIITWLKGKNDKPGQSTARTLESDVPSGRYAVEADNGELRFYRVWRGTRNPNYVKVYVQHGPDESVCPHFPQVQGILRKISEAGIRNAALRYGHEIGSCSNCGRRLTNRISRELAIGPVCGGRMFGDDWSGEVTAARNRIIERGEDPDEELTS